MKDDGGGTAPVRAEDLEVDVRLVECMDSWRTKSPLPSLAPKSLSLDRCPKATRPHLVLGFLRRDQAPSPCLDLEQEACPNLS